MSDPACPVVLFRARRLKGLVAPDSVAGGLTDDGTRASPSGTVLGFGDLCAADLEFDGHFSTYVVRTPEGVLLGRIPRLRKDALSGLLAMGARIEAHCLAADLDLKELVPGLPAGADPSWGDLTPAQVAEVTSRVESVAPILDGQEARWTWAYRGKRGYKLVYALAAPVPVGPGYEALVSRLIVALRAAGVQADYACKDWTRLFRAPRVRREDGIDTSRAPWYCLIDRSDDGSCYLAVDPSRMPLPVADLSAPATFRPRADQPSDADAEALMASDAGRSAEQLLRSSPLHAYCFGKTPFAFRTGGRHTKLTQVAGMLVKALRPQPWGSPELAYALAREAVQLLDQDEDWCGKAWEMVSSFWARQAPSGASPPADADPVSGTAAGPSQDGPAGPSLPLDPGACPHGDFALDADGMPYPTPNNVRVAIWQMGARLWRDAHAERYVVEGLDGYGPYMDDPVVDRLWLSCEEQFRVRLARDKFFTVVRDLARADSRHPVRSYLDSLEWDGVPRLESWMATYLGADLTPYVAAVGRLLLVAAVRRIRAPGTKFDEMVVLESPQGSFKSSALKILAVNEDWFSDSLPMAADPKLVLEQTLGKWVIEAGDLQGMTRKGVDDLKAFLSRSSDRGRMAYDRAPTERGRQFVIIGTTNDETYLRDSTGNRRFWPVRVGRIDLPALARDRDQLWAEAALVEMAHGPVRLDPSLYPAATEEQEDRRVLDPIEEALDLVLPASGSVRSIDAFAAAGFDSAQSAMEGSVRLGRAMRRLGWERRRKRLGGSLLWTYSKGLGPLHKLVRVSPTSFRFVPDVDASTEEA